MYYYDNPCYHCYLRQLKGGYRYTPDYIESFVGKYVYVNIPGYNILYAYVNGFNEDTGTVSLIIYPLNVNPQPLDISYQNIEGIRLTENGGLYPPEYIGGYQGGGESTPTPGGGGYTSGL